MIPTIPNDNAATGALLEPDAHGQAALLLAESTLHALVENATFSPAEAVDVLRTAAEVKVELATVTGESKGRMQASLDLLALITTSFESDLVKS
jgi:hypothetical protein